MKNLIVLIFLFFSAASSAEVLKCVSLFKSPEAAQSLNSSIDAIDKQQFFINLQKKINTSFVSQNEIKGFFEHSDQSLIKYTSTNGFQHYYDNLSDSNLSNKSKAINMRSNIENSLFLRKPYENEVYSGAHLDKSYIDKLSRVGEKIKFDYFLSTSKDFEIAVQFSKIQNAYTDPDKRKVIFVIKSLNGKSIEDVSEFGFEKEVLFTGYTEFVVRNIQDERKNNQDLRLIYLDEVLIKQSENFNKTILRDMKSKPNELQDWKKGLEFIFANSKELKYDLFDLKQIHKIVSKNMTFEKSILREKTLNSGSEKLTLNRSGILRSSDADYFISNGDHIDSHGQRYFEKSEIEGYLDNPFFFVKLLKKREDVHVAADVHFISPREVEPAVSRVLAEAQVALAKSRTDRQYILNVFKLYKALISIHPFSDANGRSVRLFIYGLLHKRNFPIEYFPTLSEYEHSAARLAEDYLNGNN